MTNAEPTDEQIAALVAPKSFSFGPAMLIRVSAQEQMNAGGVASHLSALSEVTRPLPDGFFDYTVLGLQTGQSGDFIGLYLRNAGPGRWGFEIAIPRAQYEHRLGGFFSQSPPPRLTASSIEFLQDILAVVRHLATLPGVHQVWLQDEGSLSPALSDNLDGPGCYAFPWVITALSLKRHQACGPTYWQWKCVT